jgi:hypothetical protein
MERKYLKKTDVDFIVANFGDSSTSFGERISMLLEHFKASNSHSSRENREGILSNSQRKERYLSKLSISVLNEKHSIFISLSKKQSSRHTQFLLSSLVKNIHTQLQKLSFSFDILVEIFFRLDIGEKMKKSHQNFPSNSDLRENFSLTLEKQVFFCLNYNYSIQLFNKLKKDINLSILYGATKCNEFKSYLNDFIRKYYKVQKNSIENYQASLGSILFSFRKYFGGNFTALKISLDAGGGITRVTINPLLSGEFKELHELEFNMNSKFIIPFHIYEGKENLKHLLNFKEEIASLNIFTIFTCDLGCWFSESRTCPFCGLTYEKFNDNPEEEYNYSGVSKTGDLFVFCLLHLVQRLVISLLEIILKNGDRSMKLKEWIKTNIKKNFDFVKDQNGNTSFLLDFNQLYKIMQKHSELANFLPFNEMEVKIFSIFNEILNLLLHYEYKDWMCDYNIDKYYNLISEFHFLFRILNLLDTFYSHILYSHSLAIIKELLERKLVIKDCGNWNLENLHHRGNQQTKYKGGSRIYKIKENNLLNYFSVVSSPIEEELIQHLALFHNNLEKITLNQLKNDEDLIKFRKERLLQNSEPTSTPSPSEQYLKKRKFNEFLSSTEFEKNFQFLVRISFLLFYFLLTINFRRMLLIIILFRMINGIK